MEFSSINDVWKNHPPKKVKIEKFSEPKNESLNEKNDILNKVVKTKKIIIDNKKQIIDELKNRIINLEKKLEENNSKKNNNLKNNLKNFINENRDTIVIILISLCIYLVIKTFNQINYNTRYLYYPRY